MVGSNEHRENPLDLPVTHLRGVGTERALVLGRLGINTLRELLLHQPRSYEDRRKFTPIAEVTEGQVALTCGKVVAAGTKWFAKRSRSISEIVLDDGTARLHCRWWNLAFIEKRFQVGDEVVACGKVVGIKPRTIDHPETEVVDHGPEGGAHIGRIVPIYPLTEGLSQRWLRGLIWNTLNQTQNPPFSSIVIKLQSCIGQGTASIAEQVMQLDYTAAVRLMHLPEIPGDGERARRRLACEEFLELQLRLMQRRQNLKSKGRGLACRGDNSLIRPLLRQLGFKLTEAQTRVLREIRHDMSGQQEPMRRLLQGDVGSGKTLVAFCSGLMALESGFSAALMAPTEILAEQHFRTATKWLAPLGVQLHLLTGGRKTVPDGKSVAERALYIGTHALLEPGFAPEKLGLVIIDEQHKFGVAQREKLLRKGRFPHLLVMTATPIPRTLALTLYGDLDVSTIDALPPGRGRIRTFVREQNALSKVWEFVSTQLTAGRQAYIVYPRVEDTDGNVKAVKHELQNLQRALAPHQVDILHGRLSSEDKENTMANFLAGRVKALVATSLVEVGVDAPNATVIVIESAERFGLAQLHQLRGRIGRGSYESYCILVSGDKNPEALERLKIMEKSNDGFEIAEADLVLRGPGELLGREQSGAPAFRFADLAKDVDLLRATRDIAARQLGLVP